MGKRYDLIVAELNNLEKVLDTEGESLEYKEIERILKRLTVLEKKINAAIKPASSAHPQHKKEAFFPSGGVTNQASTKEQPEKEQESELKHKTRTRPE